MSRTTGGAGRLPPPGEPGSWPPPRDPGRQPERTRLAWRRTVLAATVVGLLALRPALALGRPALALAVVATVAGWLVILLVGGRRIRAMSALQPPSVRRAVPLAALVTVGFAGLGIVMVIS